MNPKDNFKTEKGIRFEVLKDIPFLKKGTLLVSFGGNFNYKTVVQKPRNLQPNDRIVYKTNSFTKEELLAQPDFFKLVK